MPVKPVLEGSVQQEGVVITLDDHARTLHKQGCYGAEFGEVLRLTFLEGMYLFEKGRVKILDGRKQPLTFEKLLKKATKKEPEFWIRYNVYKDLRSRGYVVKTALKFGAEFRVYDKGIKPGEDHAKWVVFPVSEANTLTWYEFSAKNRVAHSTKKRLLMGIVDEDGDVTYYEVRWMRP